MGRLERQLADDRALRDAAGAVFNADLILLRARLAPNELANRIGHNVEEGSSLIATKATDLVKENKGAVWAGLAAAGALAGLLLARKPIRAALAKYREPHASAEEPHGSPQRSKDEHSHSIREVPS